MNIGSSRSAPFAAATCAAKIGNPSSRLPDIECRIPASWLFVNVSTPWNTSIRGACVVKNGATSGKFMYVIAPACCAVADPYVRSPCFGSVNSAWSHPPVATI